MGFGAGNGQPAPPARRVRVSWCPSRYVPASACVVSPPPHGEGASGTPWAILSGEFQELGTTGNVRSAAATASRLYWSRLELPTPPLADPGEGADRPPASNSPRRTPQVARSAVAPSCSRTTFCETWRSRKRMSLWSEKPRTGTHLMSGRLSNNPTERVSKMYGSERGGSCAKQIYFKTWLPAPRNYGPPGGHSGSKRKEAGEGAPLTGSG